ncbi:MAG TPA: MBL fold metallo-hydrolase [Mycobacteriales bacterium]|nr:MBL fold metallo-hydrolase [Mycobacteriales bacterium]
MKITVVGCSGSFPGPTGPASCYLVEVDGYRVVLDLGNGAVGALQQYLDLADLDAVLISHLHPDHCIDVLALYIARTYDPHRRFPRIPVYVPSGGGHHLARAYGKGEAGGLTSSFDFIEWTAGGHKVGPLRVTVNRMAHPVETWGMRVEQGGKVLAYSADTGPCDNLVELARDADLALFEAAFEEGRDDHGPKDLHLTAGDAGRAATAAGAKRLVVTHLPPWNDPEVARRDAGAAYHGPVELAAGGSTYEL